MSQHRRLVSCKLDSSLSLGTYGVITGLTWYPAHLIYRSLAPYNRLRSLLGINLSGLHLLHDSPRRPEAHLASEQYVTCVRADRGL